MKRTSTELSITLVIVGAMALSSCGEKYTTEVKDGVTIVKNEDGATLGYSASSGVKVLPKIGMPLKI